MGRGVSFRKDNGELIYGVLGFYDRIPQTGVAYQSGDWEVQDQDARRFNVW